ncbi:MAG: tetratricopeptide repeat protein [Cytophagales bacterium]|nr:tetratricopeptide repeat protein [Cytophagales bacterium]
MSTLVQIDSLVNSDPVKALSLSNNLLLYGQKVGKNSWYVAKAKERMGVCFYYLDDLGKSNKYYSEALVLFDSLGDRLNEALTLNNLGWNYRVQQKNELATSFFERSLEIFDELKDWKRVSGVLNNLGTAYRRDTGRLQDALVVYHRSLDINQGSGNRTWVAYNLNNIGLIHLDLQKYDSAILYFRKAAVMNATLSNAEEYCKNQLNLGLAFLEIGQTDSAEIYFAISRDVLDKNDFPKTEYVYNDYQYVLQQDKGNYRAALDFYIKKVTYEQEQQKQESENDLIDLRVKYETSKKEKELEAAQYQTILQKRMALIILLSSVIILLVVLYHKKTVWAVQNKRLNKELKEKIIELKLLNEENERIKHNLRKLVREETEIILSKNEKLRKYAFINSHKIRAPLARILGLIHVINLEEHHLKNEEAFYKLNESSRELDDVIRDINRMLLEEEESSIKHEKK